MKPKASKGVLILFSLLFICGNVFSLDTIFYYGANNKPLDSEKNARFSKRVFMSKKTIVVESYSKLEGKWTLSQTEKFKENKPNNFNITIKSPTGIAYVVQRKYRKIDGDKYEFRDYRNNKLIRLGGTSSIIPLSLQDTIKEYYANGQLRTIAIYENNQQQSNENWLRNGTKYHDNIFYAVDEEPKYIHGQQHFNNFILASLVNRNVDLEYYSESIVLGWVITDGGDLEGIHVTKNNYPALSEMLIDIIEEVPNDWRPATLDGENVNYYMKFPINFKSEKTNGFNSIELVDGYLRWD
jgi:hypothetical protein